MNCYHCNDKCIELEELHHEFLICKCLYVNKKPIYVPSVFNFGFVFEERDGSIFVFIKELDGWYIHNIEQKISRFSTYSYEDCYNEARYKRTSLQYIENALSLPKKLLISKIKTQLTFN